MPPNTVFTPRASDARRARGLMAKIKRRFAFTKRLNFLLSIKVSHQHPFDHTKKAVFDMIFLDKSVGYHSFIVQSGKLHIFGKADCERKGL